MLIRALLLCVMAAATLSPGAPAGAQEVSPPPVFVPLVKNSEPSLVFGRQVRAVTNSGLQLRGELLAVSGDSIWVLQTAGLSATAMSETRRVVLNRHAHTGGRTMRVGLIVGALSGLGLTVACMSAEAGGCGAILPGAIVTSTLVSGAMALLLQPSNSINVRPITEERLRPYARFPQGIPPGLDVQSLPRRR
jgi:hypothetical protein